MKKVILPLFLFLTAAFVSGQTAADLDTLLNTDQVSYAWAARFVLPAAGLIGEDASPEASFNLAVEKGWFAKELSPEAAIPLKDLSYLCAEAFQIKGGLMYRLFSGPRYAYRELKYRKMIQGRSDPAQLVPGDRLIRIIGRILDEQGE